MRKLQLGGEKSVWMSRKKHPEEFVWARIELILHDRKWDFVSITHEATKGLIRQTCKFAPPSLPYIPVDFLQPHEE